MLAPFPRPEDQPPQFATASSPANRARTPNGLCVFLPSIRHHTSSSAAARCSNGRAAMSRPLAAGARQPKERPRRSSEETRRRTSRKRSSSQGSAMGPHAPVRKPYSSSACRSSSRKMGWFRCAARTTNRREAPPTHTATCPAGTAPPSATRAAARDRHLRRVCRSQTMSRILLHLAIGS
uniref:Uncharacterized protein n=1 Tax=Triticum urartu TaxID=4572 RepID=A0A8R7PK46_TRIUA